MPDEEMSLGTARDALMVYIRGFQALGKLHQAADAVIKAQQDLPALEDQRNAIKRDIENLSATKQAVLDALESAQRDLKGQVASAQHVAASFKQQQDEAVAKLDEIKQQTVDALKDHEKALALMAMEKADADGELARAKQALADFHQGLVSARQ